MKLLIFAPEQIPVPPSVGGSVENCIYQIAKQIPDEHQVTIVSIARKNLSSKAVKNNVTILRVTAKNRYSWKTTASKLIAIYTNELQAAGRGR